MITPQQMEAIGQQVLRSMSKEVRRTAFDDSGLQQVRQVSIPGNSAKTDDDLDAGQSAQFGKKMLRAGADLRRSRLVTGRRAADDGGNPGVAESQAIGGRYGVRFVR